MVGSARMRGHNEKFWEAAAKKCGTEKAVSDFWEGRDWYISDMNPGNHMALRQRRSRATKRGRSAQAPGESVQ